MAKGYSGVVGGYSVAPEAVRGGASADRQTHLLPNWRDSTDRGELIVLHDQLHHPATAKRRGNLAANMRAGGLPAELPVDSTGLPPA